MKNLKRILITIVLLIMLIMGAAVPIAFIGMIVFIIGLILRKQNQKGMIAFRKSGWVLGAGIVLFLVLGMTFIDDPETEKENTQTADSTIEKNQEKGLAEKEAKEKESAEKEKLAEEKAIEEAKAEAEKLEKEKHEAAKKEEEELAKSLNLELVTVGRVVDGDTFETADGRKVRLVGVNTPESTTRVEEYGKEASKYTTSKLNGKKVWMQKDVSETDRYGRLLRIIWIDIPTNDMDENEIRSKMFNAELVLNGYAEPSTYQPDVKYSEHFVKFAREARENGTGLWAYGDEGTTKGDLDSGSDTSDKNSSSSSNFDTSTSNTTESYKNCTELRKVHPNGVPSTHPAYASKHDRDKDNWACER